MSMLPIDVDIGVESEVAVGMSDMAVPIAIVIVDMSILKGSQAVLGVEDSQSNDRFGYRRLRFLVKQAE